jgi:hypothetical protein
MTEIIIFIANRISMKKPGNGIMNARTTAITIIGTVVSLNLKP